MNPQALQLSQNSDSSHLAPLAVYTFIRDEWAEYFLTPSTRKLLVRLKGECHTDNASG
jgi:hypothetical protein